jgi:hypothetical protein
MPKLKIVQTTGYSRRSHPYANSNSNRKSLNKNKTTPVATKLVTTIPTITSRGSISKVFVERSNEKRLKSEREPELTLKSKLPTYNGKSRLQQPFGEETTNLRRSNYTPQNTHEFEHSPKSPSNRRQESINFRLLLAGRAILNSQVPSSEGTQNDLRKALAMLAKRCKKVEESKTNHEKAIDVTPAPFQRYDGKGILKSPTSSRKKTPKKTVNFAPYSQLCLYEKEDYYEY